MEVAVRFEALTDAEKRELAALLLEQVQEAGLAVQLPDRTKPYSVQEAAEELNVSRPTVYNMIDAGRLVVIPGLSVKTITAASVHAVRDGVG